VKKKLKVIKMSKSKEIVVTFFVSKKKEGRKKNPTNNFSKIPFVLL
jgi:hypothetical protein